MKLVYSKNFRFLICSTNLVGASTAVHVIYLFILRSSTVLALSDAQNLLCRVLAPLLACVAHNANFD